MVGLTDKFSLNSLDPVPRYRYLRDVIGLPQEDRELQAAEAEVTSSKWFQLLASAQLADGSWGRLHSAASLSNRHVPTTEFGAERGIALGLSSDNSIMRNAARYLKAVLEGDSTVRDPAEKNDRWPLGVELFAASTLAQIKPAAKSLDRTWDKWSQIARTSVQSGRFEEVAEFEAHRELTGISSEGSYLRLHSKYALALLGSRVVDLPPDVESALFKWVWSREAGIGYFGQSVRRPPLLGSPSTIELWLRSHELLSIFPSWQRASEEIVAWLLHCRTSEGLWDFGPRPRMSTVLPFSESWRRHATRQIDWTLRILLLLKRANGDPDQVAG